MENGDLDGYFFLRLLQDCSILNIRSNISCRFLVIKYYRKHIYNEFVSRSKCLAWDKGKNSKLKYNFKDTRLSMGWNLIYEICLKNNKTYSAYFIEA